MDKFIHQLSDEQLMVLLAFVEDHQISRAIDYLRKYAKLRLDQAKAVVLYCVEQRQQALYNYHKKPRYVPRLHPQKHIQLEEEYQFDDAFLDALQFSKTTQKATPEPISPFLQQAKQESNLIFALFTLMCLVFIFIVLTAIYTAFV